MIKNIAHIFKKRLIGLFTTDYVDSKIITISVNDKLQFTPIYQYNTILPVFILLNGEYKKSIQIQI